VYATAAGSWDSTIRAWDIRSRACLHVCSHHHGDVYGEQQPLLHGKCGFHYLLSQQNQHLIPVPLLFVIPAHEWFVKQAEMLLLLLLLLQLQA
jgi:WD40 repeat protein